MAQIQEPPSPYATQYPYNNVTQTESGHFQEFDDTPGAERIRTQHRAGTFTEWQPDGTEVHRIVGKGYRIVAQDDNVIIKGTCNISIEGNAEVTIKGDAKTNIQGNKLEVIEGSYGLVVKGDYTFSSTGNMTMNAYGASSRIYAQSTTGMSLNTDLQVDGQVLAASITSKNEVTAGTGMHAGPAGYATEGGVHVGLPGPAVEVGVVTASVMVTAPAIIGSVVTFGAILMDPEGGAPMIRAIYDSHIHPTPKGPSGTGIPQETQ